jgi:hypothetical protein
LTEHFLIHGTLWFADDEWQHATKFHLAGKGYEITHHPTCTCTCRLLPWLHYHYIQSKFKRDYFSLQSALYLYT